MKKIKNFLLRPSDIIAGISALFALLALAVSIRGCNLADQANQLATNQYQEDRLLILQGEFSKDGNSVILNPITDESKLLEARVIFPTTLTDSEWRVKSSDKTLWLSTAKFGLQQLIKKHIPQKEGFATVGLDKNIPILIKSHYANHGKTYEDLSIYLIGMDFSVGGEQFDPPTIYFTGLKFHERLDRNSPFDRVTLDRIFGPDK